MSGEARDRAAHRNPLPRNPILDEWDPYPFTRLAGRRAELESRGLRPIDLSLGDPQEVTPEFIRRALVDAIPERSSYPTVVGRPPLRAAIAAWYEKRFGIQLDPETQILPAGGSKEAIYHLALALVDRSGDRRRVVYPVPAYPVYARGARLGGGDPAVLPLSAANGYLPDLEAVSSDLWRQTALLWLNYPHNPTGAVASTDLYRRALELAEEFGFVVASDEAYSEIYFDDPPPSLLQAGGERALIFHSLSKRSAMTGYRSGFVAGDPELIAAYRGLRPSLGVATPEFIQAAAAAAWGDEEHVRGIRETFAGRRKVFLAVLDRLGLEVFRGGGTIFLWITAPGGDDLAFAERWFEIGVLPLPGSWLGEGGRGFLRLALVPTLEECEEAARRLESSL
jgi:succinyldiaminopimelate transaminase